MNLHFIYAGLIALGLALGWFAWEREKASLIQSGINQQATVQRAAADQQRKIDQARIDKAGVDHAQALLDIAKYSFDNGVNDGMSRIVCRHENSAGVVPETPVYNPGAAPTEVVAGHDEVHNDITRPLQLFARLAAGMSADYAELADEVK